MRSILVAAIAASLIIGAFYSLDYVSGAAALFFGLWIPAGAVIAILSFSFSCQGSVSVDASNLVVRTRAGRSVYRWDSIENMRLVTFAQLGGSSELAARLARLDRNSVFVEIALRKRPKVSLMSNLVGTDIIGLPQLSKRLHLHLIDPQEFLIVAQEGRRRAGQ